MTFYLSLLILNIKNYSNKEMRKPYKILEILSDFGLIRFKGSKSFFESICKCLYGVDSLRTGLI